MELTLPEAEQLDYWADLDPLEAGVGDFPPSLEETDDQERLISWIRIRPAGVTPGSGSAQRQARLSWIGINAAQIIQRAQVVGERLADGSGEPDQRVVLAHQPVIVDSLQLTVNGEPWRQTDDLAAAPAEALSRSTDPTDIQRPDQAPANGRVFTLDRQTGEIQFGNGIHGVRPPRGAVIQASYAYGGGLEGMVGIGAIGRGPDLPTGIRVHNPLPTYGGDRAETVAEAEQRIPGYIRHRNRLVSLQDFYDLTHQTPGVEMGRVEVLPLFHPDQNAQRSSGVVTVLVIPRHDPHQPRHPSPDRLFLESVCRYLAPRRLVTSEIQVRGPRYKDIWVSVGIDVISGRDQAPVREAVRQAIQDFLSPLKGGFEGQGWPLNKAVEAGEIAAAAVRVEGVAKIVTLHLGDGTTGGQNPVSIDNLQLPRLRGLAVTVGQPPTLEELQGQVGQSPETGARRPVPVIPESC